MRVRIGLVEGFKLTKTVLALSGRNLHSLIFSLIKNAGRGSGEITPFLEFMFGKRQSYLGVILHEGGEVKHSVYVIIDNGRVEELGSLKLKSKEPGVALKEFYRELGRRGEVSKIISYGKGGEVVFHPN